MSDPLRAMRSFEGQVAVLALELLRSAVAEYDTSYKPDRMKHFVLETLDCVIPVLQVEGCGYPTPLY